MGTSIGIDVLDRLFAPHGASAYFRRLRGTPPAPRSGAAGTTEAGGSSALATRPGRRSPARAAGPTGPPNRPASTVSTSRATQAPSRTGDAATSTVDPAPSVTFAASRREAASTGTLLETAEAAGLTPRFRCRRGICGTCTTAKVSGTVVDLRTGETSDAAEPIRLCVSEARTAVCLDL